MKVTVIGTGYVGLVTGTCLAETGNEVTCVDIDKNKVARMQVGEIPIHEPKLDEIFVKNIKNNNLKFTNTLHEGVAGSQVIFLALPTPEQSDGSADLSYVIDVADKLGPLIKQYVVVVDKSTVPPGSSYIVTEHIAKNTDIDFDVVSNPEFLREGQAVDDFMHPDRIVIGTNSDRAFKIMEHLYRPYVMKDQRRIIHTDAVSAETAKYAANALLATKISFMNELAGLAEVIGADISHIREIVGTDSRIGLDFMYAGPGWGGSCFPKDTKALEHFALQHKQQMRIVRATIEANASQKQKIPQKVQSYFGSDLSGKKFALWGLAFKKDTDDVRESPALAAIDLLIKAGAKLVVYDPQAMKNVKKIYSNKTSLKFVDSQYAALKDADALLILTDWTDFKTIDIDKTKTLLKRPIIFDGRNLYDVTEMEEAGFYYESIGRRTANGV